MRFVKKIINNNYVLRITLLLLVIFLVIYIIIPDFFPSPSGILSLSFYGAIGEFFLPMLFVNGFYNFLFFKVRTTPNTWKDIFNDALLRTILGVFVFFVLTLFYLLFIRSIDNIAIISLGLLLLALYIINIVCNNRFLHQSKSWYAILGDSLLRSAFFVLIMFIILIFAFSTIS